MRAGRLAALFSDEVRNFAVMKVPSKRKYITLSCKELLSLNPLLALSRCAQSIFVTTTAT